MTASLRQLLPAAVAAAALALPAAAFAQKGSAKKPAAAASSSKADAHPAAKVVQEYLNCALQRQWAKSAALVDPKSLDRLVFDYVRRLKAAPTIDDERQMLERVGKQDIKEVEQMAPLDFYTAYHKGMQERFNVSDEAMKAVRDSLEMRILSVAEESPELVHVLVRTVHNNGKSQMSNLELISLVKAGDKWKVSLDEQMPKVTPVPDKASGPDNR